MYFFYVDESGNTGDNLADEREPIHWLVAVGIQSTDIPDLEDAMRNIATRYVLPATASPDFEFHGSDIFQGRGYFDGLSPDDRVQLYEGLLELLDVHDCHVLVRGIHKQRHADRATARGYDPDHPHKLGFMYLMEEMDRWLETQQPAPSRDPEYGLVVADVQREVNRDLIERFPRWRTWGTDHGYRTREIEYLIDTIHTVPSHDSWLMQLADCVAFMRNRYGKVHRAKLEKHAITWLLAPEECELSRSETEVRRLWTEVCTPRLQDDRVWPPK